MNQWQYVFINLTIAELALQCGLLPLQLLSLKVDRSDVIFVTKELINR
jgi:hypothetical protein